MDENYDWTGWVVEDADPDVGIFTTLVTHDLCGTEGDPAEVTEDVSVRASETAGLVDVIQTFTCVVCKASVSSRSQEPVESFEMQPGGDE